MEKSRTVSFRLVNRMGTEDNAVLIGYQLKTFKHHRENKIMETKRITVGKVVYYVLVVLMVFLLFVIGFTVFKREQISSFLQALKETTEPPAALAIMESASPTITYLAWAAIGLLILAIAYAAWQAKEPYKAMETLARWGLIEHGGSRHDVREGLRLGAEMAGLTAFTWVILSPVPIVPGSIHLRTFAFMPGLVALLFGRGTGFLAGYFGSIIWALLANMWSPVHTPVVDGVYVGVLTGWLIAVVLRGNRTREELLTHIEGNPLRWIASCMLVNLAGGLAMSVVVAASLKVAVGLPTWWLGFFTIGVISDTAPMVIFTAFLVAPLLRLLNRYSELPNF